MKQILLVLCCMFCWVSSSGAQTGYVATFVKDAHCSITTYTTSDYATAVKEENATSAYGRDSSTGAIITSGKPQVNFLVVPAAGYAVDTVTATPTANYNNLKGPLDTAVANMYRLTVMTGNVTVTVTTKAASSGGGLNQQPTSDVYINLSDSGITVDGSAISTDTANYVFKGNDIIYYLAGQGSSYGEGTAADGHTPAEAAEHTVVHITQPGTYHVSGTLSKGQIFVDLSANYLKTNPLAKVNLVMDGASITCTVAPAVLFYYVYECSTSSTGTAVVDTTAAGSNVTISDGTTNTFTGSHVAKIYKTGTTSKLHKYDGAFHSKMTMNVAGGTAGTGKMYVNADYEGLDAEMHLTVNSGNIWITAQNDGINTNEDGISVTTINGGYLHVIGGLGSEGDGIDSNGYLVINGGTIVTMANPQTGDGGIDADSPILLNGGTVMALGSRNDSASTSSGQPYIELSYSSQMSASSSIVLTDENGTVVAAFTPSASYGTLPGSSGRGYQSVTISTAGLKLNTIYYLYMGGVLAGSGTYSSDGLYIGGIDTVSYSQGTGSMMRYGSTGGGGGTPPPKPFAITAPDYCKFQLTSTQHSFTGVSAYSSAKTAVAFKVNDDNTIADATAANLVISYKGAFLNTSAVTIADSDIQVTIMDYPSESFIATGSLDTLKIGSVYDLSSLFPTETGNYCLTIAVKNTNATYTGVTTWYFNVLSASETGSLSVTLSPAGAVSAGAQWCIDGVTPWTGSGTVVNSIPVGVYTVQFKDITGYVTPATQQVSITNGGTAAVTATYIATTTGISWREAVVNR